jgi:hypothetical protein
MFEVKTNHSKRLIHLRMSGVLAIDEAHACAAAKEAAVERLGRHMIIRPCSTIRELRLQPQEVFAIFTTSSRPPSTSRARSRSSPARHGADAFRRVAERAPLRNDMRFFTSSTKPAIGLQNCPMPPVSWHVATESPRPHA